MERLPEKNNLAFLCDTQWVFRNWIKIHTFFNVFLVIDLLISYWEFPLFRSFTVYCCIQKVKWLWWEKNHWSNEIWKSLFCWSGKISSGLWYPPEHVFLCWSTVLKSKYWLRKLINSNNWLNDSTCNFHLVCYFTLLEKSFFIIYFITSKPKIIFFSMILMRFRHKLNKNDQIGCHCWHDLK